MPSRAHRQVRAGLMALGAVSVTGTLWYWLVEGFSPLQALYQTVQTVSTVGLREVRPLDTSGQLFTIVLIFVGVGAAFVTLEGLFAQLVEAQTDRFGKRRTERRMADLRDHVVVCGYGRIGAKVAELLGTERQVLVIEQDADRAAQAAEAGYLVVHADATDDETLGRTAIERASVLVAALPTDADNLFIVLSGRGANPSLRIVARAQSVRSDAKLLMAGADRVVNPEDIGARRLAAFAQRPTVSEFLDVVMHGSPVAYRLEEIVVPLGSRLDGRTIRDAQVRDRTGSLVLGVRTPAGEFVTNPGPDTVLSAGSTLIAIGTDAQLAALAEHAGCSPASESNR